MREILIAVPIAWSVFGLGSTAKADDWVANKLRGQAMVLMSGQWVPLKRGDVVSTSAAVRTAMPWSRALATLISESL